MADQHEHAMERAVELIHRAEDCTDYRERDSLRALAQAYTTMARELRLGTTKSKTYKGIKVERTPPPPAKVDSDTIPPEDYEGPPVELPPV